MSGVGFDAAIHLGLGFGLNEVFIMTGHWIFIIPIAAAYLFKSINDIKYLKALRFITLLATVFLYAWNISLFVEYFA